MDRLKNKVAVVTGGAKGIGRATSLLFAREGATVAIADIADADGAGTVEEIKRNGGNAGYWHLDVRREAEVQKTLAEVHAKFGKIDVLVNSAGIPGVMKPTHELSEQEWDGVMAINVKGVLFCTKHVIPFLKGNGGGSIINLSSIYGLVGSGNDPAYHAAKGAVRLMSKNDAMIYAPDHIRVNSVHPGFIWTGMVQQVLKGLGGAVDKSQLVAMHPIGRLGEPEDVAWGILYLASDEASFVTGTELVIDGGYTAR